MIKDSESSSQKPDPVLIEILEFIAEEDLHGMLYWRTDDCYAPITFWINSNDVLAWGCADVTEVNEETLAVLNDCKEIDPVCGLLFGCDLFACRIAKSRPQGAAYPKE